MMVVYLMELSGQAGLMTGAVGGRPGNVGEASLRRGHWAES